MQHPTQSEAYWTEEFEITQSDIEHLFSVLLEREAPLSLDEMALVVVRHRVGQLPVAAPTTPSVTIENGYSPDKSYEPGDVLVFPALNNVEGKVVALRDGHNPDFGDFDVMKVELDDGSEYEFVIGLELGSADPEDEVDEPVELEGPELAPEELFIEYGGLVSDALESALDQQADLVRLAGEWFPRSLLVEVHDGHLNLAEAILDMEGGGPMATAEIIEQIGMIEASNELLAEFSMNYGLQQDPRFDEVGPIGQVVWYLMREEPDEVRTPPPHLAYEPVSYDRKLLTEEMLEVEKEIGDEHTQVSSRKRLPQPESVTLTLTYAHYRSGTLPLSPQLRRMFPTAHVAPRIHFTLVDAETNDEHTGWVVRNGGYVYGLADWMQDHEIPVGGYLTITRTEEPGRVLIDYARRKPRKEWVRTAFTQNNRLRFENRQWPIGSNFDDLMILAIDNIDAVDLLWEREQQNKSQLESLIMRIASELAPLTPQGHIHLKTLYSATNILRRLPPGPMFATLTQSDRFEHVGGPYWRLKTENANSEQ